MHLTSVSTTTTMQFLRTVLLVCVCSAVYVIAESTVNDGQLEPLVNPIVKFTYAKNGKDWTFGQCSSQDTLQSPIDLVVQPGSGLDSHELEMYYPTVSAYQEGLVLKHVGSTLELEINGGKVGYIISAGHKYHVKRVVFRAPSEHSINGTQYPMEMQIVHERVNAPEQKIVLSTLFQLARNPNPFLDAQLEWRHLPASEGLQTTLTAPFQLGAGIFGLFSGYFSYEGSLTEPPCTDKVWWYVLESIQEMDMRQLNAINDLFKNNMPFAHGQGNNRALQPRRGRSVILHNHHAPGDGDGRPHMQQPFEYDPEAFVPKPNVEKPLPEDAPDAVNKTSMSPYSDPSVPAGVPVLYKDGGENWSGYCKTARYQSPIDITLRDGNPHGDFEMKLSYDPSAVDGVENAGYAMRIEGEFGHLDVLSGSRRRRYRAIEATFHSPSEHTIDGRRAALEMQIMHVTNSSNVYDQQAAILSVLFHEDETRESAFLKNIGFDTLPKKLKEKNKIKQLVNLNVLEGIADMDHFGYYSYAGSLSIPPCSPNVRRFVLRKINDISSLQLKAFRENFNGNIRKIQPANNRGVNVRVVNDAKDADLSLV
jgi:carbonic anhydrase